MIVIAIFIVLLLDWLIGDPYSWPHPVKLIGNFIYACLKLENLKTKFPFLPRQCRFTPKYPRCNA